MKASTKNEIRKILSLLPSHSHRLFGRLGVWLLAVLMRFWDLYFILLYKTKIWRFFSEFLWLIHMTFIWNQMWKSHFSRHLMTHKRWNETEKKRKKGTTKIPKAFTCAYTVHRTHSVCEMLCKRWKHQNQRVVDL